MIFQSELFELDLSDAGVSLQEENDLFTDSINRNFTLPFTIEADGKLLTKLGFPTTENVVDFNTRVEGRLLLYYDHFPATLFLGDIQGNRIECNISWGRDNLSVFDLDLKELPWGFVFSSNLRAHAQDKINKSWPEVQYNFPKIYRPEQKEKSNYEFFAGFMNNHDGTSFLQNTTDTSGGDPIFYNRNILAPTIYALEILKKIYATAGKKMFGEIWDHDLLKKICYVPKSHLEKFRGAYYESFHYDLPTSIEEDTLGLKNFYRKVFALSQQGTYVLDFKMNLDPVLAEHFHFRIYKRNTITEEETDLLSMSSISQRVTLDEKININVDAANTTQELNIELTIKYTQQSIQDYNSFEFTFSDGKLNEFPSVFSLRDFLPDMTAGEYVNMLKNWWNLDIDYVEDQVTINFAKDALLNRTRIDHSHLQDPKRSKSSNRNRLFKLSYENGEEAYYNYNGRIYSVRDEKNYEEIPIKMPLQPLEVVENEGVVTAVFPEDNSDFDFVVYDGPDANGVPLCSAALHLDMTLDNVVKRWWEPWLYFRVNSFTSKDSIICSVHEAISKEQLSIKYNEVHVIVKLKKKYLSEKLMEVEVESETF